MKHITGALAVYWLCSSMMLLGTGIMAAREKWFYAAECFLISLGWALAMSLEINWSYKRRPPDA